MDGMENVFVYKEIGGSFFFDKVFCYFFVVIKIEVVCNGR